LDITPPQDPDVCMVLLANLHEYFFLYGAFAKLIRGSPDVFSSAMNATCSVVDASLSDASYSPVTRALLGIPDQVGVAKVDYDRSSVVSHLLGPAGSREELLQYGTQLLGFESLSADQSMILQSIDGTVAVVETFAGGSKTTLSQIIAGWILERHDDARIVLASSNKAVVSRWIQTFQSIMSSKRPELQRYTALLGYDATCGQDSFDIFLHEVRQSVFMTHAQFYEEIDGDISNLMIALSLDNIEAPRQKLLLSALIKLLNNRFIHLDTVVYPAEYAAEQASWSKIRLVGVTCSYLSKMNAGHVRFMPQLRKSEYLYLIHEEYQAEVIERMVCMTPSFDAVLMLGDPHQAPTVSLSAPHDAKPVDWVSQNAEGRRSGEAAPLRYHSGHSWMGASGTVQHLRAVETFRICQPALGSLKQILPSMLASCEAPLSRTTKFWPVLCSRLSDWFFNASMECVGSQAMFSVVLCIVALELISSHITGKTVPIAISTTLLSTLNALRTYLHTHLPAFCERRCAQLGVGSFWVDFDALKFHGPFAIGGVDVPISIPVIPRRLVTDKSFRGLSLQDPLIYAALSRGSVRIWPVIEDLRNHSAQVDSAIARACGVFGSMVSSWYTGNAVKPTESTLPSIFHSPELAQDLFGSRVYDLADDSILGLQDFLSILSENYYFVCDFELVSMLCLSVPSKSMLSWETFQDSVIPA